MLIRTSFLALSLCILCIHTSAQKNAPGFYVTLNGDTITGNFLHFKEWTNNPSKLLFESNIKKLIELTPDMCKNFTVTGFDTYDAREIKRMTNANAYYDNHFFDKESSEPTYDTLTCFLRRIYAHHSIVLYEFRDSKRANYFIQTNDSLMELIFKIDYKNGMLSKDKEYITQLQSLFANFINGNKKLENKLLGLAYTEEDFVSFLKSIYGITVSGKPKVKYPPELIFSGGIAYNTRKVIPLYDVLYVRSAMNYNPSISPVFCIDFVSYSQRNFGKYFASLGLKYTSFQNAGEKPSVERWEYKAQVIGLDMGVGGKWIQKRDLVWYTSAHLSALHLFKNEEIRKNSTSVTEKDGTSLSLNLSLKLASYLNVGESGHNIISLSLPMYIQAIFPDCIPFMEA